VAIAKAAARSLGLCLYQYFGDGREVPLSFVYVMFGGPAFVGLKGVGDFQEYALIPLFAESYREGYLATLEIYGRLCDLLARKTGNEKPRYKKMAGIPVPQFGSNEEALAELTRLIVEGGYIPRKDFGIYLDVAASQLHEDGSYRLEADGKVLSTDHMLDWLEHLCDQYPIISVEDGLFEEDWKGWSRLTRRLGDRVQLAGDDLFTTNRLRLEKGIDLAVANAIVIKPNQVGTLTETKETISLAKKAGYGTIISPRSGELWDPYLVHFCVGNRLGQGKITGAFVTGESNVNEICRISDSPTDRIEYAGKRVLTRFL
jgi:enolase